MKRFPFAVAATVMAFTATVGAQGPKAGTTGATQGARTATTGGTSAPKGSAQAPKAASAAGSTKSTASGQSASNKPTSRVEWQASRPRHIEVDDIDVHDESTGTSTSTGTTAAADVAAPNAVSIKVGKNPAQMARIQPQLDALGLTLEEATEGFRNQGQFLAALNAAKNRNLDSWRCRKR